MDMKESFQEAKKDEVKREHFLKLFLTNYPNKAVSRLTYNESQAFKKFLKSQVNKGKLTEENYNSLLVSLDNRDDADKVAFCARANMGIGMKSQIFIMPAAFKLSFDNFVSAIVDHEYIHAEHVKNGIMFKPGLEYSYLVTSSFDPEIILNLDESIAYCVTISKALGRNNNSSFINGCVEILEDLTKELEKKRKFTSVAEESAVKIQISKNKQVLNL